MPGPGPRAGVGTWPNIVEMDVDVRPYRPADEPAILALSLPAWAPVFTSLESVLGRDVFSRLHPDWRDDRAAALRHVLFQEDLRTWVAEDDGTVVPFVTTALDRTRRIGEIAMIAVDPDAHGEGIGGALTAFATDRLRRAGTWVAMVETGGDAGHAPARRVYERVGYRPLAVGRYFQPL